MTIVRTVITILAGASIAFAAEIGRAAELGPGVSDKEIKIGNTMPYSGPASAYGIIGKTEAAYFNMLNEQGGINGRRLNFISRDDGYSPPKTVEQVRQLVEQENVLLLFSTLGTPTNTAIHQYANENKVPQLFISTGADKWNDPKHFPWTMGWIPSYGTESHIYASYILANLPTAKIAVLYQNDDFGKDYLNGLRKGLGDKAAKMIVATQSYETTDPTVDFANCCFARKWSRGATDGGNTQIRSSGNSQSLRYRVATYSLSDVRVEFRRHCHENCGIREGRRDYLGGVRKGPHRPAVAGHNGIPRLVGVYEEVQFIS